MKELFKYIFAIIFIILVFYYPSFSKPFSVDDSCYLMESKNMNFSDLLKSFTYKRQPQIYRPLGAETYYYIMFRLFGINSLYYAIMNILFFISGAMILFFVIKEMTHNLLMSFLVVFIYITRTTHVFQIYLLGGIPELIASLFVFLSFLSYLYFNRIKKMKFFILSIIFYILALLSKETAVVLPFAILAYDIIKNKLNFKKSIINNSIYFIIMAIYLVLHSFILPTLQDTGEYPINFFGKNILTNFNYYFYGTFDEWTWGRTEISYFFLFFSIILFFIAILNNIKIKKTEKSIIIFGLMWYFIFLIPFIFLDSMRSPYYLHMPILGVSIIISLIVLKLYEKIRKNSKIKSKILISLIILFIISFSYVRIDEVYHIASLYTMQELSKNCVEALKYKISELNEKTLVIFQQQNTPTDFYPDGVVSRATCAGTMFKLTINKDIKIKFINYNKENFENLIKENTNEVILIQNGINCYLVK